MIQFSKHYSSFMVSCEPNNRSQILDCYWQIENKYFHLKKNLSKILKIKNTHCFLRYFSKLSHTNKNEDRAPVTRLYHQATILFLIEKSADEPPSSVTMNRLWQPQPHTHCDGFFFCLFFFLANWNRATRKNNSVDSHLHYM